MRDSLPGASVAKLYATLWRHAEGRRHKVVLFVILLVLAQIVRLTIPWFFGEAVNALQAHGMEGITRARNDLLLMLAAVGVAWTMHGPARILERFTALVVRERFADALHVKALALPVRWHEQHHSGDTLHRMTRATTSLASFAQSQFIYLQNTVSIVGPIAALFLISRATGATALAGYAAIGYFVVRIDAFMVLLVREENRADRRYNSALVDCLGNIATVLTLRLQEPMRMMLRSRLLAVFAPLRRNIVFNEVKWGGIDLLNSGMRTGLVALYAWLDFHQHGTISVGTAVVVHQYSQQVGNVVASMAMHWNDLVRQKTEVGDVDPIFASPARSVDNAAVPRTWRDIRVEGVRYVHPAAGVGRPALDDISMELRRGQRIALIGESGAGKSSLLRVLAGLVDAERVSITVDATPHPHLKHLGAVSLLLPQDPAVFESSVRENVTMGLPYREADIDRACELAGLTSVIAQLPQGFDTLISERGLNLSGGQKQRLALARGLLAASDVGLVLLDEATSSVDASTEAEIYDRVMSAFAGACIVSSVHRLHLLRRFDTVMVMEQGRVVDSGAPDEVRQRRPDLFAHSAMEMVAETRAA
ncbi:MAG: ABC transporter ATP-binding protein [Deltaproteobacteria bacterium]|nr:MAG: ABC transporter ATP-binding protein [Deltaproteobacteria bacterium]